MSFNAFLKIDGIPGDSQNEKHKDWIEIIEFKTGIKQPTAASKGTAGGAPAGRANFDDFKIVKAIDKSTPLISVACANGTAIKEIKIELCRAGGDELKYMEYILTNSVISSQIASGPNNINNPNEEKEILPTEEVTFNFGKINWSYTKQNRESGAAEGNVAGGWDLEKNRKL